MSESSFEQAYAKLNPRQKEAVNSITGPLMVVAGPGTGKTELLALRVANILKNSESGPSNILCLTFTDNATENMRLRLQRYIGADAFRTQIFTFHGFCNSLISDYPEYFYNSVNFSSLTDTEKAKILNDIFAKLPFEHPLSTYHSEVNYVYLNDTASRISQFKSAGLTPEEYLNEIAILEKEYPSINKVLKTWPEGRCVIKRVAEYQAVATELDTLRTPYAQFLGKSLMNATLQAIKDGKTEAIGKWKKTHTYPSEDMIVFMDCHKIEKIKAVADIYKNYTQTLHKLARYDYEDMILEVAQVLKNNLSFCNQLAEQYHYILIDEFQDTNDAQMSIVRAITSAEYHRQNPNIMAVGDDDQAIYKFQGAEVSNIINFRNQTYPQTKTVVLDTNYRSHKEILDFARKIVVKGINRLENHFDDISKELSQGNKAISSAEIKIKIYNSDSEEYINIAREIRKQISAGIAPQEIAILSRKHKELKEILPYLDQQEIPYEYIKSESVFDEKHIRELIAVMEYVSSVSLQSGTKDYLLPEILTFPYFKIERELIFELALKAKKAFTSWSETLANHPDQKIKDLTTILARLATNANVLPLEHLLDDYMKNSGFKDYYFNDQQRREDPAKYIKFLGSLKVFIQTLREWRKEEMIYAKDLAPFIEIYKDNKLSLTFKSPQIKSANAVQILSVHAAKGLEFASVFVLSAHDDSWTRPSKASKAPIPLALHSKINPAGDSEDDFIRLFYVAITRAKHSLFISGHKPLIRYLGIEPESAPSDSEFDIKLLESSLSFTAPPYKDAELISIKKLLEDYQMSVTHLQNFLDVKGGGPEHFLKQNLFYFPEPIAINMAYGSAIHKALEHLVLHLKHNSGEYPSLDYFLNVFSKQLTGSRLPTDDYEQQLNRGLRVLTDYYNKRARFFKADDQIEVNLRNEGITIGSARVNGRLDFLRTEKDQYHIIDYKTGEAHDSWETSGLKEDDKIKLHKYQQQLVFYKMLLENSVNYRKPIKTLALEFVGSITQHPEPICLSCTPGDEELERLKKLTQAVYTRIINLNFPDISKYPKTCDGIVMFEEDLIREV